MEDKREELYQILMSIDEFNVTQYNRLALIYGEYLVNEIINKIILEHGDSLGKFNCSQRKLYSNLNFRDDVSLYDYYMDDVCGLDIVKDSEKVELLSELISLIREMDELFVLTGCDRLVLPNKKKPWLCDKVKYSLDNCNNISLLNKLNELYNEYLVKREKFMRGYLKFVVYIARQYYREDGVSLEDLVQFGNMGLIRAIELYKPEFGKMFSTYAGIRIKRSIIVNSKNTMYTIRKPFHIFALNNRRVDAINAFVQEFGREPSDSELADYMNISIDELKLLIKDFTPLVSIDELHEFGFEDTYFKLEDSIVDEGVDVMGDVFASCLISDTNKYLFECLDDRERLILKAIYEDNMNFFDIGLLFGISKQRVSSIHKRVLEKLKKNPFVMDMKTYLE